MATNLLRTTPFILLADDHSIVRAGLRLLCESIGYSDVSEASSCNEVMKKLAKKPYTHLVLDINLSDGSAIEIIPNIRNVYPNLRIMALSMQPADIYGKALRQFGIYDYISKDTQQEEIITLLRQFFLNEQSLRKNVENWSSHNPFSVLTSRELEILHYLLKGTGTSVIASSLNVKLNTISTAKAKIFEKTQTTNLKELMELAVLYKIN